MKLTFLKDRTNNKKKHVKFYVTLLKNHLGYFQYKNIQNTKNSPTYIATSNKRWIKEISHN